MSNFNTDVGLKIFNARKNLKMSRAELGKKINLHESTIKRYEDGHIKSLDIEKLKEFASALDISPAYLMGWKEEVEKTETKYSSITEEEQQHIEDLRKLNDIGKNKVVTYTKDLMDNPKFINEPIQKQSEDEISATSIDDFEPYLLAAHSDGLDEETNKANIEKIKEMYLKIKGK